MLATPPNTPAAEKVLAETRTLCDELGINADLDNPGADTVATQLSLVATGVACGRAIVDDAPIRTLFVAGHSVGAFAAAVLAGVLSLREALIAVHVRAESMQSVCSGRSWGMAAISGLPTPIVAALAGSAATADEPVWLANINTATQTVVAGTQEALAATEHLASHAGARSFDRLDIAIASHGPLQEPTARAVEATLAHVPSRTPAIRYITNAGGRAISTSAAILADLAWSVARPVRWYDGMRLMAELGVTCTVEATPGHTLTRLATTVTPDLTAIALSGHRWSESVMYARREQDR
jgi:malonate decarboxylase epsilon subunit